MIKKIAAIIGGIVFLTAFTGIAHAQSTAVEITNTGEGVSSQRDKKRRNPVVSVSTARSGDTVKLLVDAHVPQPEHREFPIRFDFYVNRKFFTSQIRSKELPGAVGVDIGPDVTEPPFNYSVVATLITPNRNYTTIINGAVFKSTLSATLDCTVMSGAGATSKEFVENNINTTQEANDKFSLSFTAEEITASETVAVSASLTVDNNNKISGTITTTLNEDQSSTATKNVTGTATMTNNALSSFSATSDDGTIQLVCS